MPIPAIVLAAGASCRLGQPKQLVSFGGETLLARAIRIATDAGADPVFVMLGAHAEAVRASVNLSGAVEVWNEEWASGMASSVRAGLNAVIGAGREASGVLLMTCDQPRVTADHLRNLLRCFDEQGASGIVASSYAGINGVPAVFPRAVFSDLMALTGDKGARALLSVPPCRLYTVQFEDGVVDIDLPGDLDALE